MNHEESAIRGLLREYETALNASDTDAVMRLYATDGVFMAQYRPSSVGSNSVRTAYEAVFAAIRLDVEFTVAEIEILAPDAAFARTISLGRLTEVATGATAPEANQELFVLRKIGSSWKIARYCFSSTNPPR